MKIPCDTIARLAHLLPAESSDDPMCSFRLDNGKVLATNRRFMAIEQVAPFEGVFYIRNDPALIAQCRTEAQWSGVIEFTPVAPLKWTTAATTMGWKCAENLGLWPVGGTDYDLWRERVVDPLREPLTASTGPMMCGADGLAQLAASSPSGGIVFEQHIDPMRGTVVRDIDSHDWVGFFHPRIVDGRSHNAATVPGWCR